METKTTSAFSVLKEQEVNYLHELVKKGGPDKKDYDLFLNFVNSLNDQGVMELRKVLEPVMNVDNMIGFGFVKPFGYAGDFKVIDMIYQVKTNSDPRYKKWDIWYHEQYAPKAVRNRKEFFKNELARLDARSGKPKEVLVLGSGPATDVFEYLSDHPESTLWFDLVDLDQRAIDYAKEKNQAFLDRLNFIRMNVLRYQTHKFYDLIWSAGLFDYFKEKHFIYLLKKYHTYVAEEGEMIIGNFSDGNPSVRLMHALCDWDLVLRNSVDLIEYAIKAGADKSSVSVDKEPLGVNLFLRVKKPENPFRNVESFISWLDINNN